MPGVAFGKAFFNQLENAVAAQAAENRSGLKTGSCNLDPWRMVANSAFFAPLTPPDPEWRSDPFDNQTGELIADGVGLLGSRRATSQEMLDFAFCG